MTWVGFACFAYWNGKVAFFFVLFFYCLGGVERRSLPLIFQVR